MDRHDRIEQRLAEVPLFAGLSKKELRTIAHLATYLEEPEGTVLTAEGESGNEFIIVLEGEVEVQQGGEVIATRGAGDYFGEIALHRPPAPHRHHRRQDPGRDRGDRPPGVHAGCSPKCPELAGKIMATMAQRLADLEDHSAN